MGFVLSYQCYGDGMGVIMFSNGVWGVLDWVVSSMWKAMEDLNGIYLEEIEIVGSCERAKSQTLYRHPLLILSRNLMTVNEVL
jgi:hypothetical protein